MQGEEELLPGAGSNVSAKSASVSSRFKTDLHIACPREQEADNADVSSNGSDCTATPPSRTIERDPPIQLRRAAVLAARGRHEEALQVLSQTLSNDANNVEALFLQGQCLAAAGNKAQALAAFAGALSVDTEHVQSLLGYAAVLKEGNQLQEALAVVERAYRAVTRNNTSTNNTEDRHEAGNMPTESNEGEPRTYDASTANAVSLALAIVLTDLGTHSKLHSKGEWQQRYERALTVCPSYAPAHYNLGVAAAEAGQTEEAVQRYTRAVELEPRYAEAWCNMGVIYKNEGRLQEAIAAYEHALAAAPNLDMISSNLAAALTEHGTALKAGGDPHAGIKAYERALALRPRHAEALYNLGVAYAETGDTNKAIFMYEMAIAAAPQCAEAHNNLGVLHRERGNMERAISSYEAALAARPAFPQGLNNLAVMYTQQGRAEEALNLLRAALIAHPEYAEAFNNLGVLQRDIGDAPSAIESYDRCCALDPDNRNAGQNRLLALNYVHHGETELVCSAHAAWGRRFQQLHPLLPPVVPADVDTTPGRPLVVGYLSPDLFVHSVSYFAEAPLTHHNRTRVHVIVYSVVPKPDDKTARLRKAVESAGGTWRDAASLSEEALAALVRADKVDILIELTGHTAHNRLGAVARRPAPVQATWIGYPNSTGLDSVDYRFTDAICDPLDTQQTYTEELVRLPGCFLCYTPSHDAPSVAPLPALQNNFVTFGSFNALAKQTPEVLRAWACILRSLPGSRLVLKNKPFACSAVRRRYWAMFEQQGVSQDRIDLLPLATTTHEHLSQYALMDICLDPWPYAGTTTTAEALFMGVPCLTLAGGCHAHNVGASLLTAVGLERDWVAHSEDEYVAKAMQVTADVDSLQELRAGLRKRMVESPMCDAKRFVAGLEDTYDLLWQRWVDGEKSRE